MVGVPNRLRHRFSWVCSWVYPLALGLVIASWVAGSSGASHASETDGLVIIVNQANSLNQIRLDQVVDYFLKKKRQWPDGTNVRFIDHKDESPEREAFLNHWLKKTGRELDLYWIGQKLYTGDSAPMQVTSDSMMASVISRFKGAIGYVSSSFNFSRQVGVKSIEVLGGP